MFSDTFSRIVIPEARRLGILGGYRGHCERGGADFDVRGAICYCVCYAWMHYASFKEALALLDVWANRLPYHPLVIDIGCGPATALLGLGEWLHEQRGRPTDIRYLGIDRSAAMRDLAERFARDGDVFGPYTPTIVASLDALTDAQLANLLRDRDGIIITMSYILNREFMLDGGPLFEVLHRLSGCGRRIRILGQDANMRRDEGPNQHSYPDTRLNAMLEKIGVYGFEYEHPFSKLFEAVRYNVDNLGNVARVDATGSKKSLALTASLRPA